MNKCTGCGIEIDDTRKLCQRCFHIQHYGQYEIVVKEKHEFLNMLTTISQTKALVVLVLDLFNLNPNLEVFNLLKNNILLVLTKKDLLPDMNEERLLNYIDKKVVDKLVISSKKNYHIDMLMEKINKYKNGNIIYVVGYTNTGKSTMINKIIENYTTLDTKITTSLLPNTTLDEIKIELNNELTIIDTPGIMDEGSIYYQLDSKELKRIVPKTRIKPISFQVKKPTYFRVEQYLKLDVSNNNVIFFISNNLSIQKNYKNFSTNLVKHQFNMFKYEDLVIPGMGFIKFTKSEKITIYVKENIHVFKRKSLI